MNGWIGVDLDGTLAYYDIWRGPDHIGEPIPKMLERVKWWVSQGRVVIIFTARVASNSPTKAESEKAINTWCMKHLGYKLPVTAEKDYGMVELWDDRCVQVIPNTGTAIQEAFK